MCVAVGGHGGTHEHCVTVPTAASWFWYYSRVMQNITIREKWGKGTSTALCYFCNFLGIYNYLKIKSQDKKKESELQNRNTT